MKNKKNFFWCIASFLWVALIIAPIIYYARQMKFPVIAGGIVLKIIMLILILLPVIFILISKLTGKEKVLVVIFSVCIVLNFISVFIFNFGFTLDTPFFYPVVSYTDSVSDYMILDENVLYIDQSVLSTIFPESVPENATDITYEYYCDTPSNTVKIYAKWTLPKEEYFIEKRRLINDYEVNSIYEYSSLIYNFKVEFNDQEKTVHYIYEQAK